MIISKIHKHFSERLYNSRVLTNPEEFLGPNFEAVLNFWLINDELTEDQWETIWSRYWDFRDNHESEWRKAFDEAIKVSNETIGWNNASRAAWDAYGNSALHATYELIGMHLLLDQENPLTFFPMFLEVL